LLKKFIVNSYLLHKPFGYRIRIFTQFIRESVSVFCTGKNKVVKIVRSSSKMVLQTIKHIMIYLGLGPSLEVIVLRLAA
jgi:hypothetical protein